MDLGSWTFSYLGHFSCPNSPARNEYTDSDTACLTTSSVYRVGRDSKQPPLSRTHSRADGTIQYCTIPGGGGGGGGHMAERIAVEQPTMELTLSYMYVRMYVCRYVGR